MPVRTPYQLLRDKVDGFFSLNPDLTESDKCAVYDIAAKVDPDHFPEFADLAEKLIHRYLVSAAKEAERQILSEYFDYIDRSARLLAEKGEVSAEVPLLPSASQSVNLVNRRLFPSLDWCKILNHSALPKTVVLAVDACKRRNQLLASVTEYMLVILQQIDSEQAMRWELDYLERHRGELDPDLVRDVLNAWLRAEKLPRAALDWAKQWSGDENLLRQWPTVVHNANRLLRNHTLRHWNFKRENKNGRLEHLRLLLERQRLDDRKLLRWLESALITMGESVHFFTTMNQEKSDQTDTSTDWRGPAMLREIKVIEALFTPILLLGDLILDVPDGAYRFALAFFGLVGSGHELWEKQLQDHAEKVVRRAFLRNMKLQIPIVGLIEKLTFGDQQMYLKLTGELDWITKSFDSISQREKVVKHLAIYYGSFRESQLLAKEISKRYRDLMRVLHEDNLRRVLPAMEYEKVAQLNILLDLASVAADARRFLTRRRVLNTTLEDMVAVELDFARSIRQRQLYIIETLHV